MVLTADVLEKRKQRRRNLIAQKELVDLEAERISAIVKAWDNHPDPKPIGKDFYKFVYDLLKNSNYVMLNEGMAKPWAEKAAQVIGWRTGQENPLYMEDSMSTAAGVKEQHSKKAETIYTLDKPTSGGMYKAPEEITRYCPQHPGSMLQRIKDGVYQCHHDGEIFSLDKGHEVTFDSALAGSTHAWNEFAPEKRPTLLDGKDYEGDKSKINEGTKLNDTTKIEASNSKKELTKKADYFGCVEGTTRNCPEHRGVQMARVADGVYQCPIDGNIFRQQSSVAGQTPDDPSFYTGHGIKASDNSSTIRKADARGDEIRFANDIQKAFNGEPVSIDIVRNVINAILKGDVRSMSTIISDVYSTADASTQINEELKMTSFE